MAWKTDCYNLVEEEWIPVLFTSGEFRRVGIRVALVEAGQIRQIAASNPLDNVALLRFLLAIIMWCKEDAKSSLDALDESSAGIPEEWLAKLKENRAAFNLLGDGKRFYQDKSLAQKDRPRSIADLLVEFPGKDSVNHLRHVVHDGSYGFCPACCALGIVRFSVYAPANRFYPSSVNPASSAYALIEGNNLLRILCANLPDTNPHVDQAPWLSNAQANSTDPVTMLAWRPRSWWLMLNEKETIADCAYCGQTEKLVTSVYAERGWETPVTEGQRFAEEVLAAFQRLHSNYKAKKSDRRKMADKVVRVASVILKCRMAELAQADSKIEQAAQNEDDATKIARVFDQLYLEGNQEAIKELTKRPTKQEKPQLEEGHTQAKKFWSDDPHLLRQTEPISLPSLDKDVAQHAGTFWRTALAVQQGRTARVTAIGPVVNKFVFQDAVAVALPDASDDARRRSDLSAQCGDALRRLLKNVTHNPQRQHPELEAALILHTPDVEARIRDRLIRIAARAGENATIDEKFLHDVYAPVVEQVMAFVTPGSPLRRRAARNHAQALLRKKIKELVENPGQPAPGER